MLLTDVQPYDSDVLHLLISTKNLLVAPTFVKRRKLICTPDTFLMKFKFERIILKSMTLSYWNAYQSCSMMVRFKLQRCTIYESVAGNLFVKQAKSDR